MREKRVTIYRRKKVNKFLEGLLHVSKDAGKVAVVVAPVAVGEIPIAGPVAEKVLTGVLTLAHPATAQPSEITDDLSGGDILNPLETMAITMVLGALQMAIKNPAHKAALQSQLVGLATDIFQAYGMTVPAAPAPAPTA
jgi:hypothetical protein